MPNSYDVLKRLQVLKNKHNEFVTAYNNFINNNKKYISSLPTPLSNENINVNSKTVNAPSS